MTSKLKCPFCQTELEQMHDKKLLGCPKCLHIADGVFWVKAIQAKQDLKIATKALESISGVRGNIEDYYGGVSIHYQQMVLHMDEFATNALEQIEHKE